MAVAAAGAGLIARGVTGRSALYRAAHIDTRDNDTRRMLADDGGIHVQHAVLINRPLRDVFAYWRDLRNLPRFMSHLLEVTPLNGTHSHWVAKGPAGKRVEWDAEIINEVEDKVIGWRSLPGSDLTRSETMIAGRKVVTFRIASSPSAASAVWNPQACTSSAKPLRVAGSSSTISTRSPTVDSSSMSFIFFVPIHVILTLSAYQLHSPAKKLLSFRWPGS